MNGLLLNFLSFAAWAAVLEYIILRLRFVRWNLGTIISIGVIASGISWTILFATFGWGWSAIFHPPYHDPHDLTNPLGSGASTTVAILLVVTSVHCVIALIPSVLTAIVYWKLQKKNLKKPVSTEPEPAAK